MKEWRCTEVSETISKPAEEEVSTAWILSWLKENIAKRAQLDLNRIHSEASFADYPLESIDAAELSEQLSEPLGYQVEAESFWALPSLQELAVYLYEQHKEAKVK